MKCTLQDCPGMYEDREIVHPLLVLGNVVVIDPVPAKVCSICGDVQLSPEVIRHIERLIKHPAQPATSVPLYEYA